MSWNSRRAASAVVLVAIAVLGAGCGSGGEDQETKRWANELILVTGDFEESTEQGRQKIAEATTRSELEAAYKSYGELQREEMRRVEGLDPPAACEDEQAKMEKFMRKVSAVTEELADQASMTPARLKAIEGEVSEAKQGLIANLKSVAKNDGC